MNSPVTFAYLIYWCVFCLICSWFSAMLWLSACIDSGTWRRRCTLQIRGGFASSVFIILFFAQRSIHHFHPHRSHHRSLHHSFMPRLKLTCSTSRSFHRTLHPPISRALFGLPLSTVFSLSFSVTSSIAPWYCLPCVCNRVRSQHNRYRRVKPLSRNFQNRG